MAEAESTSPIQGDPQAVLDLLIPHARALLDAQVQDVDELATKALGVLAVAGAVLALLAGARDDLTPYWWVPSAFLVAAGGLLLSAIWPQQALDSGPDPLAFYERFGGVDRLTASQQMLAQLNSAFDHNAPTLARRGRLFNLGFVSLTLGLVGAIVVVLVS
jgi:hypothetical protein